jgi:hypothetical protein
MAIPGTQSETLKAYEAPKLPKTSRLVQSPCFSRITRNIAPIVFGWTLAAGIAASFFVERIPYFRTNVFCKIPILGDRYAAYRVEESSEE